MSEKLSEKSLANVLRALPDLLKMEQVQMLLDVIIKQWGIKNILAIPIDAVRSMGPINMITSLLTFKLDKILQNLLASMWDVFGDREAIISGDKRFTFREFKERVFRLANGLQSLGLKPKDKVVLMLYNGNEYAECDFANSLIGCICMLTSVRMGEEELITVLNRENPKVIIFDEGLIEKVNSVKDRIKSIEKFIVVGENIPENMISYEDLISRSSNEVPKSDAFILALNPLTSGTTGISKSVNYYDFSYAISSIARPPYEKISGELVPFGEYLKYILMEVGGFTFYYDAYHHTDKISHNMRILIPAPMNHAATTAAWVFGFLLLGSTIVPMRRFDPEGVLKLIEEERISLINTIPTMLFRILALPDDVKRKYDLSSVYTVICAGAPCPVETKKAINELFIRQGGRAVYTEYEASTETGVADPLIPRDYIENPKRLESTGKVGRGTDQVNIDPETGEVCPPNVEGEIWRRSIGTIFLRYGGVPEEETRKMFRVIDGKEYFDEGLIGYMDEDGFSYLTGRKKDLIIPGGVNIYPDEVEAVILKNPKVADVAVIAIPDKDLGEAVGAVVQLEDGEKATEEEVIEGCKKGGLYGYKIPKKVDFWKELPRNPEGKMVKREIEKKYWEDKGIKRRG